MPVDEIATIEGLDEDIATELQSRATEALERREATSREERRGSASRTRSPSFRT